MPTNLVNAISLLLQLVVNGLPILQTGDAQTKEWAANLQADIDAYKESGQDITTERMQLYRDFASAVNASIQSA